MKERLGVVINVSFRLNLNTLLWGIERTVQFCKRYTDNIIVVADRRTIQGAPSNVKSDSFFMSLLTPTQESVAKLVEVYSVDTCDRWLGGFGWALESKGWELIQHILLLPGDFEITEESEATFRSLLETASDGDCEIVVGTIKSEPLSTKQLIDTYATYALMLVWFPEEARRLIQNGISKPRSEFFCISKRFLRYVMAQRWFPYEQTLVILLRYLWWENLDRRPIGKVPLIVGAEAGPRDLTEAITQLERMERVMRFMWRERAAMRKQLDMKEYELIDSKSAAARKLAVSVFETLI